MKIRLYHGSQNELVEPKHGFGQEHHDFGRGFYLTDAPDLAKEWSVYRPNSHDGWVHAFDLDMEGLNVLDFRDKGAFAWVAELMRHRDADDSAAYRRRAPLFIEKFGVAGADGFDVQVGWRAFYANHAAYECRDVAARDKMRELIADQKFNRLERLFSDVIREGK